MSNPVDETIKNLKEIDSDEISAKKTDKQEDLNQLNQFLLEKQERLKWKMELKQQNQNAAYKDESQLKKLDSSIKKVTAFIKRLKTLTESQKDTLSKEMAQLNLSKYLSEVAAAFTEAKLKMNDISCALHLCSQMHQNYAEYSSLLFEQWQKILNIKKDDKILNPSKLRVDLRFFAELISIGVLAQKEALSLLGNQLTVLTLHDKEFVNISIISSFCKHCGEDFANLIPAKYVQISIENNIEIPHNNLYSIEKQKAVKTLLKDYFKSLCQFYLNEHKEIQKQERQNKKTYQTKGELNAEKKEKYEQAYNTFKKLSENTEILADLLGEKIPDLPIDELNKKDDDNINIDIYTPIGRNEDFDSTTSPWEDEETRQFYELIPDLKALVPGILYKESEKSIKSITKPSSPDQTTSEESDNKDNKSSSSNIDLAIEMERIEKEIQELEKQVDLNSASNLDDEQHQNELSSMVNDEKDLESLPTTLIIDEVEAGANSLVSGTNAATSSGSSLANSNMKALMDSFITQLPNCVNRELIDKAAKEFCMNLNTKLNRKRLVGALFQVQRTRLDLLPFYSRFVAILNPCMPELSIDLSSLLLNDFRFHVRKKDQINIESKIKTARFIGELVKFNMFSRLDALNCLKTLLADFKHHNVEMACNLLDVCGRYLYRNQESHMKLKLLLEILMRKKQATSMDGRYSIMVENAFYYCNPPESKQDEKKVKSPIHEYIKKLLYKDLNKLNVEKILRQMRRLNWDDETLKVYAVNCLTAAWNIRYNSIHCLANLVSGLALYHEEIGIQVVDGVIEDIRIGLEINLPKYNQRRVSMIKYIGELYNYRMVESSIIFKTLYLLITYGVTYDVNEIANNDLLLDPADNMNRVKFVCTLLETCGQYFNGGSTRKKLDCFLIYFQRYYLFKKDIALIDEAKPYDPLDVEYIYTESILSLRSDFKFVKNYADSVEAVIKMETEARENLLKTAPHLLATVKSTTNAQINDDGLDPINEDEELDNINNDDNNPDEETEDEFRAESNNDQNDEEVYDDEDDEDEEEEDDDSFNPKKDASKQRKSRDSLIDADEELSERKRNDSSNNPDQNADSSSEIEDSVKILPNSLAKKEISAEDEEFMKQFDSILTENIAQRTKEVIKMPSIDIAVPMHLRKLKPSNQPEINDNPALKELKGLKFTKPDEEVSKQSSNEKIDTNASSNKNKGFNFVVMIKKGNKTQYHNMEVPMTSDFANQFANRIHAEKVEKEKLKQLTLNMNERLEQEELQEMMQTFQSKITFSENRNRDRHQKYNHPRGPPDNIDSIFGSSDSTNNRYSSNK